MAEAAVVHHRQHCGFDFALGDMARPDRVPFGGMLGEIAFGRRDTLVAHRRQPPSIMRDDARFARGERPFLRLTDNLGDRPFAGDAQENPASLAPPLDDSSLDKDTDMARYARLALVENDREFADRKLHLAQQRDDSQSRRIRESAENVDKLTHQRTYKAFFISGQPSAVPRFSAVRAAVVAALRRNSGVNRQKDGCTPFGEWVILRAIGKFRDRSVPVPVDQFH